MKTKWCWVAKETNRGWKLKLCIGNRDLKIVNPNKKYFKSTKAVENFCDSICNSDGKIVFVHLKNTRYPEK
jgi:hypothetical protein